MVQFFTFQTIPAVSTCERQLLAACSDQKHTSLPHRLSPNIFVPFSRPKIWWFLRFMFVKMCASVLADILLLDLHPIITTIIMIITLLFSERTPSVPAATCTLPVSRCPTSCLTETSSDVWCDFWWSSMSFSISSFTSTSFRRVWSKSSKLEDLIFRSNSSLISFFTFSQRSSTSTTSTFAPNGFPKLSLCSESFRSLIFTLSMCSSFPTATFLSLQVNRRRLAPHSVCGESMFLIQVPRRTALQWHLGSEKLHSQYGNGIRQWPSKSSIPASLSCHVWIQGCRFCLFSLILSSSSNQRQEQILPSLPCFPVFWHCSL